jgi:hypothetical protein
MKARTNERKTQVQHLNFLALRLVNAQPLLEALPHNGRRSVNARNLRLKVLSSSGSIGWFMTLIRPMK